MIPALSTTHVRRWRRRVPLVALSLAVAVPLLALVVTELALDTDPCTPQAPCRFPLSSTAYHVVPVAELLAMGTVVLALLLPRAAVWVAAVTAALIAGPASVDSSVPALWLLALLWFVAAGAADLLGRWHQVVESHSWGAPTCSYPDAASDADAEPSRAAAPAQHGALPDRLPRDEDTRLVALVVAGIGVVLFGGMLAWHLQATAAVREMEAHAVQTQGQVTKVGVDGYPVTVRAVERDVQFDPMGDYRVGDSVPVLVDASDPGRIELVAEPADPSWRIGVGALLLAALLSVGGRLWSRGTRRAALVRDGGPAVRLRVGRQQSRVVLTTVDDREFRRPLSVVHELGPSALLLPLSRATARDAALWHPAWDDGEDTGDHPWEQPPDVAALTDAELAAWADREVEAFDALDDDEDVPPAPEVPLAVDGGAVATVVGLRRDGDPVLLLMDDGDRLVSLGGSRDPWTWRRLRDRLLNARPRDRKPRHDDRRTGGEDRAARRADWSGPGELHEPARPQWQRSLVTTATALVTPVGLPLAYVVALAVYPAVRWLLDGEAGWFALVPIAFAGSSLAEGLVFLGGLNRPAVDVRPGALLHQGRWLQELLPVERVREVTAGRSSVVLRLADPDDALALPPQAVVRFADHLRQETTPEQAAFAVEQLLRQTSPIGRSGWRRPSPALVPGVLAVVGMLAAWAQAHFG